MVQPSIEGFREQYHATTIGVARRLPKLVNREYIQSEERFPIARRRRYGDRCPH
jgi:hypothetical protein